MKLYLSIGLIVFPSFLIQELQSEHIESDLASGCTSATGLAKVVCLAEAFKATLDADQLKQLQLPYAKGYAVRWSNFPELGGRQGRVGVKTGSLNPAQLAAAKALMSSVLVTGVKNEGFDELEGGMAADDFLGDKTGKKSTFSSGNYFLAFIGTPSTSGLWELQFGGHHFAFANTYKDGVIKGVTPSFRGVEPVSFTQGGQAYEPLEQERQAFETMLSGLSSNEQSKARLSSALSNILLGPDIDNQFPKEKQGLRVGDLSADKQALVLNAIKMFVNDLDVATADIILTKYKKELADTYVAFSGTPTMNKVNDYIRFDGPNIWFEYSAQHSRDFPGTIHPHSVWRDRSGDYGGN